MAGSCEHGDKISGSIKCRVFLISLLPKEGYVPYRNFVNLLVSKIVT